MSWRTTLTLVLLGVAIASGIAILRQRERLRPTGPAETRPDYVLRDFEIITLKKDGTEGFTLQAPLLARSPGTKEMDIDQPTFLFPDKEGGRWRSRSATGWVNAEGTEVKLRGNVLLDETTGAKPMRLQTEALNVYPDADRATSDQLVTVTQPGSTIRGRGLEAQLDTQRVTLKSEVRAQYAPSIQ